MSARSSSFPAAHMGGRPRAPMGWLMRCMRAPVAGGQAERGRGNVDVAHHQSSLEGFQTVTGDVVHAEPGIGRDHSETARETCTVETDGPVPIRR